jgi:hypothetical protein
MLLMEIVSWKRNSGREYTAGGDYIYFPVQVVNKLLEGDVESLVDNNLHGDVHLEQVERSLKVACWCIQDDEFDRPTKSEVVQCLEGLLEVNIPIMPRLLQAIAASPHSTCKHNFIYANILIRSQLVVLLEIKKNKQRRAKRARFCHEYIF